MISVNEKKRNSIKEKFNLKNKWEINKWKIRLKEKKLKKRKKISSIIYLYRKSRRKSHKKKDRPYKENWKRDKDSNKLWRKMMKINVVLKNRPNVKEFK